jgi:hypothetical protein
MSKQFNARDVASLVRSAKIVFLNGDEGKRIARQLLDKAHGLVVRSLEHFEIEKPGLADLIHLADKGVAHSEASAGMDAIATANGLESLAMLIESGLGQTKAT